jgi:FixJ family two-component response regulator
MSEPTIYIVDDDASVRDALALLLGVHNLRVRVFASAEDFLAMCQPDLNGCALVDMHMPRMGGLEMQREMVARGVHLPIVIMTAHANVAASRMAFKAGAVDFLVKPLSEVELLEAVREALAQRSAACMGGKSSRMSGPGFEKLTGREQEVLALLAEGMSSREVAARLAISHRTVETYKGRIMEKLNARKLTDLVRLAVLAQAS